MPKFESWLLNQPKSARFSTLIYSINVCDMKQRNFQSDLDSLVERGNLMDDMMHDNENISTNKVGLLIGCDHNVSRSFTRCTKRPLYRDRYNESWMVCPDGKEFEIKNKTALYASRRYHFHTSEHGIRYWIMKRYVLNKQCQKVLDHVYYVYRFYNPNYDRKD